MKLNILALIGLYNHHISMARGILDALEAHGVTADQGRDATHISVGDLFTEPEDTAMESRLAELREVSGIDEPDPVPVVVVNNAATPKANKMPKAKTVRKKRDLSPEARERIAAAQRKRWAAHRNAEAEAEIEARPS